jgi:hypothetical protein
VQGDEFPRLDGGGKRSRSVNHLACQGPSSPIIVGTMLKTNRYTLLSLPSLIPQPACLNASNLLTALTVSQAYNGWTACPP